MVRPCLAAARAQQQPVLPLCCLPASRPASGGLHLHDIDAFWSAALSLQPSPCPLRLPLQSHYMPCQSISSPGHPKSKHRLLTGCLPRSALPLQLLISETLMKSMDPEGNGSGSGNGNGSAPTAAAEGKTEAGTPSAATGEAPQPPPLRKVDIEELDDSAGGGDD